MVFMDDLIQIYVDFLPVTATTSSDDALALLISMYTIFELSFPKNNRTMRLLYSVLHAEKRFLTNTIRLFLQEKQIDIVDGSRQNDSLISVPAKNESPLNAVSSQSSAEAGKASEANVLSTENSSTDDVLSTTIPSQITRISPPKSPVSDDR